MPTPLPEPTQVLLVPPDATEVAGLSRAIRSAVAGDGELSATQRLLLEAVLPAMTGPRPSSTASRSAPRGSGPCWPSGTSSSAPRIVQTMVLLALLARPIPPALADRVAAYAREACVEEGMLEVARRLAEGSLGLAAMDFERNGYTATWHPEDAAVLHTSRHLESAWQESVDDPELARSWAALEELPDGTLVGRITEFYRARGFTYPGLPGSAPPLLAQHDWVHVVADYGTTVESELEVFVFIARANDDMHAFSLLAMVVSLFETGYLRSALGLFEYSPGRPGRIGHGGTRGGRHATRRAVPGQHRLPAHRLVRARRPAGRGRAGALRGRPEGAGRPRRWIGRTVGGGRHQPLPAGCRRRAGPTARVSLRRLRRHRHAGQPGLSAGPAHGRGDAPPVRGGTRLSTLLG